MYGIIHGGSDLELRRFSAGFVTGLPFDGFALGGTLGKDREEMLGLMRPVLPSLPPEKPRHVLGNMIMASFPSRHLTLQCSFDAHSRIPLTLLRAPCGCGDYQALLTTRASGAWLRWAQTRLTAVTQPGAYCRVALMRIARSVPSPHALGSIPASTGVQPKEA